MKKLIITTILFIFFISLQSVAFASCSGSSPTWSCSADSTSSQIQSCINSATAGDTINIGAGSGTWNNISITKGINLIGAGIGSTIITAGTCDTYTNHSFMRYHPADYTLNASTPFRLSGFTFNLNNSCGGIELGVVNHSAPFTIQTSLRIDHNRFYNKPDSTQYSYIFDRLIAYGVIDNNTFEGGLLPLRHHGGADAGQGWWETSPQNIWTPGSSGGMYVEDNTFTLTTDTIDTQIADTYESGGKYIYRYNTITSSDPAYGVWDMHGNQSTSNGSFGGEIYGNRVDYGTNYAELFITRGGKSFVFLNSVVASSSGCRAYDSLVSCPASQYHPELQMVHDTYFWGSRYNYTGNLISTTQGTHSVTCDGRSDRPLAGTDFFGDNTSPGVSCGTLANRPSTCTTGAGYWVTNQSCSNLTGMVGVNPSSSISGTLYKCTATDTWTSFYTPYEYPHPLRGESGGGSYVVTIAKSGDGTGTVSEGDGHIDCGSTCSYDYYHYDGQEVTFTATPATGMYFSGWTGGCVGAGLTCTVTISEDTTITASFTNGRKCSLGAGGGTITVGP